MAEQTIREFDVIDFSQFYHRVDEEVEPTDFVGGFYARKHVSIIASKAGVGKTWYLLKLMADLSNGGTICIEQSYFEPKRRVLYLAGETGVELLQERIQLMHDKPNTENVMIISALEMARSGYIVDIDTKEGADYISGICRGFKPDLLILDTLMSFRFGDENSNKETAIAIQRLKAIADKNNVAIVATHHLRKRNKQKGADYTLDQDEIIGGSSLVRFASNAFILSNHEDLKKLNCVKSWWKQPPKLYYKMIERQGELAFEMGYPIGDGKKAVEKVKNYILANPKGQYTVADIVRLIKVGRDAAARAIRELGMVECGKLPGISGAGSTIFRLPEE